MSTDSCGAPHPDLLGVACAKSPHPYGRHMASTGQVWDGLPRPVPTSGTKAARAAHLAELAQSVTQVRTGAPTLAPPRMDPDPAATWRIRNAAWIEEAKVALEQVCRENEEFTTAQIWARVTDTTHRRSMVIVVRHGLRLGWMREQSAIRVKGEWPTLDGKLIPVSKLVPIYRSAIFTRR